MSPDGRLLPRGEVGEVVARGDLVMTGYWNRPDLTAATIVDGWLHTGDRGMLDAQGFLYLKDRLREVVITGGFNVYPIDVENALGQHPAVHECAVFGVPDDKWGESVKALIVPAAGTTLDPADVVAWARTRIAAYKIPKSVEFIDALPRNPSGKVLRRELRAPYWEGRDRAVG